MSCHHGLVEGEKRRWVCGWITLLAYCEVCFQHTESFLIATLPSRSHRPSPTRMRSWHRVIFPVVITSSGFTSPLIFGLYTSAPSYLSPLTDHTARPVPPRRILRHPSTCSPDPRFQQRAHRPGALHSSPVQHQPRGHRQNAAVSLPCRCMCQSSSQSMKRAPLIAHQNA